MKNLKIMLLGLGIMQLGILTSIDNFSENLVALCCLFIGLIIMLFGFMSKEK